MESNMTDEVSEVGQEEIQAEHHTSDATKGAMLGGAGGIVAGAMAGATMGPAGALVGAIAGGLLGAGASGAAVAAVDTIDYDDTFTGFPTEIELDTYSDRDPLIVQRSRRIAAARRLEPSEEQVARAKATYDPVHRSESPDPTENQALEE
jgi:hypothetical protein